MAADTGIHEVKLGPHSTRTDYVLRFLNKVLVGVSLAARPTMTATAVARQADGTIKKNAQHGLASCPQTSCARERSAQNSMICALPRAPVS